MSTATSQQQPATTQIRGVDHPRGLPPHEIPHEIQLEIPRDIPQSHMKSLTAFHLKSRSKSLTTLRPLEIPHERNLPRHSTRNPRRLPQPAGVYHLRGLLAHPSNSQRPPTSAESTATRGVYLLRGQPYGIIPYDHTWPLVYPALRTLSDVHVSTLPFMNRGSYYHCTDWTPGSLPGRDNPNVEPPQAGGFSQPGKPTSWESLAPIG